MTGARFVCNAWPEYQIVSGTRVYRFHHGLLETDDEGAALIRSDSLFGRRIFESDPDAPAHGNVPAGVVEADAPPPSTTPYCSVCDQVFATDAALKRHMTIGKHREPVDDDSGGDP